MSSPRRGFPAKWSLIRLTRSPRRVPEHRGDPAARSGCHRLLAFRLDRAQGATEGRGQGLETGRPCPRRSLSVLWEKATNNLTRPSSTWSATGRLLDPLPGVCPNFTVDEYHDVDHALHEHEGVLAALARAGSPTPRWSCSTSGPTARR